MLEDGMTFHMGQEQLDAALGTPYGRGLGYMLKAHKSQFGQMNTTVIGQQSGDSLR